MYNIYIYIYNSFINLILEMLWRKRGKASPLWPREVRRKVEARPLIYSTQN